MHTACADAADKEQRRERLAANHLLEFVIFRYLEWGRVMKILGHVWMSCGRGKCAGKEGEWLSSDLSKSLT